MVAANRHFHRALNLAARSPRLLTYLRQAERVVPGNYFELFPEQEQRSRHEHAALLDAMERGDGSEARRLMEAHVLSAGEALGTWLAKTIASGTQSGLERGRVRARSFLTALRVTGPRVAGVAGRAHPTLPLMAVHGTAHTSIVSRAPSRRSAPDGVAPGSRSHCTM